MSKNDGLHPDFGQFDRFFFNANGELSMRAHLIDDRGILLKLGNRILQFDHPETRLQIKGKKNFNDRVDFPTTGMYYGEADIFGYSAIVENEANSPIKLTPTKYVLLSRLIGTRQIYIGGLSAYAVDNKNGMWKGMTQEQFKGWIKWLDKMFEYDPDTYKGLQQWVNKCKTSASIRFGKPALNVLAEARRGNLKVVENEPPVEPKVEPPKEDINKVNLPVIAEKKEEPPKSTPKPVPMYGRVSEIEKLPENLIAVG